MENEILEIQESKHSLLAAIAIATLEKTGNNPTQFRSKFLKIFGEDSSEFLPTLRRDMQKYLSTKDYNILANNPVFTILIHKFALNVKDKTSSKKNPLDLNTIITEAAKIAGHKLIVYSSSPNTRSNYNPTKKSNAIAIYHKENHYGVVTGNLGNDNNIYTSLNEIKEKSPHQNNSQNLPNTFGNHYILYLYLQNVYSQLQRSMPKTFPALTLNNAFTGSKFSIRYFAGIFATYDIWTSEQDNHPDKLSSLGMMLAFATIASETLDHKPKNKNLYLANALMCCWAITTFGLWANARENDKPQGGLIFNTKIFAIVYVAWLGLSDLTKAMPLAADNSNLNITTSQDKNQHPMLHGLTLNVLGKLDDLKSNIENFFLNDDILETSLKDTLVKLFRTKYTAALNQKITKEFKLTDESLRHQFDKIRHNDLSNLSDDEIDNTKKILTIFEYILNIELTDPDEALQDRRDRIAARIVPPNQQLTIFEMVLGPDKAHQIINAKVNDFENSLSGILIGNSSIKADYLNNIDSRLKDLKQTTSAQLEEYATQDLTNKINIGSEIDQALFKIEEPPHLTDQIKKYLDAPISWQRHAQISTTPDAHPVEELYDDEQEFFQTSSLNQANTRPANSPETAGQYLIKTMNERRKLRQENGISEPEELTKTMTKLEEKIWLREHTETKQLEALVTEYQIVISDLENTITASLNGQTAQTEAINPKLENISKQYTNYINSCIAEDGQRQKDDLEQVFMRKGIDVRGDMKAEIKKVNEFTLDQTTSVMV